jgi:hypothetical protein
MHFGNKRPENSNNFSSVIGATLDAKQMKKVFQRVQDDEIGMGK